MEPTIQSIGKIQSALKRIDDCPLQGNENAPGAEIIIFPEFAEGIGDIAVGSEILLLTWLHKADRKILACKPRNDPKSPLTGIFSTRSPDRPNPIGIHSVEVLSISENGAINVSGLEVIDQTPLVDIKPLWNKENNI